MRGAVQEKTDTANHASWVYVDTSNIKKPIEIQNQLRARFTEAFQWGAWFNLNIGRWIGLSGMNFLLKQAEHFEEHWVGTFSNMGAWKIDADPVVVIIPTAPSTPLSVGCVTIRDRLSLSLHIHPQLKIEKEKLEQWLEDWIVKASQ
jgi:hypothetical protein